MKSLLAAAFCLVMMTACNHVPHSSRYVTDAVTVIRVEFRNEPGAEDEVRYLLKLSRVSDWEVNRDTKDITIKARYQELPPAKAVEIGERLDQLTFVLDVDIRKDGMPVRNPN